ENRGYTVGYSETMKDPLWVYYTLKESEASNERLSRPKGGFETDTRTKAQITTHDYVGSGYDRGHMAPSYAIGKYHDRDAQIGTFVMSNIVPQSHYCNDGVWNSIERMEADDFTKRFKSIEVVDGPVFDANPTRLPSGVAIPSAFYKVIKRPDGQLIAFLVPQYPESPNPEAYLTTVDEIQKRTGIDIFPEATAEQKSKVRKNIW
ncbi:MAG: DNA/RNA non-specific endonuclease, partial [Chthoniobacterales bacterium]